MVNGVLYDDGSVRLDDEGLTLRRYYFPLGTSKQIPYGRIQAVRSHQMGWLSGKLRLWGSADAAYWLPLDLGRPRKDALIVVDVGAKVQPAFTPADPEKVLQLLDQRTR